MTVAIEEEQRLKKRGAISRVPLSGACVVVTLGVLVYLGGGIVAPIRIIAMIFGVLLPLTSLIARLGGIRDLDAAPRFVVATALTYLSITPLFYLRRAVGLSPTAADAGLIVIVCSAAILSGAYRRLAGDLKEPILRAASPWIFLVIPVLFALTWMGYGVKEGTQVAYYGLFPIDFANLTSVVGLIKASPGLPHWPVAGSEIANYHWLYFTFAAWLSSFGGGAQTPNSAALATCNLVTASFLFAALCALAQSTLKYKEIPVQGSSIVLGTAIVTLASLVLYPYQFAVHTLVRLTHIQSLGIGTRNGLMLSFPNSMTVFGNNTVAVILALLALYMLVEWNRTLKGAYAVLGGVFLAGIIGYSITLFFPMGLCLAIWLLAGKVRRWWLAALCVGLTAGAGIVLFDFGLHLFGSSKGLAIGFDRGNYIRHAIFIFLPVWCLALVARRFWSKLGLFWTLILSCLIVPSFLFIAHTASGQIDFSMKISTLLAAATLPMVCVGLDIARQNWKAPLALTCWLLVFVGLICTCTYAGQFAVMRMRHFSSRVVYLPADYVAALNYIRSNTPADAIIIDPETVNSENWIPTNAIGERRVYLPTTYTKQTLATASILSSQMAQRNQDFDQWAARHYNGAALSREFASHADYFVTVSSPAGQDWKLVRSFGRYRIYESALARQPLDRPSKGR